MNDFDKVVVEVNTAPKAIGPYSQAIKSGNLVFLSMQIALDAKSGELVGADAAAQTRQILRNIQFILEATASTMARVMRTTLYLIDMNDFQAVNEVYGEVFNYEPPTRSTIQVAGLPRGARVGIDVIATCKREDTQFSGSRF